MRKSWLCLFLIVLNTNLWAQYQLKGIVKDEAGSIVGGTKVSVAGKELYVATDAQGKFVYELEEAPQMPLKVNVVKPGYELREVHYGDEEQFLEVVLRKLPNPEQGKVEQIRLASDSSIESYHRITVIVDGNTYQTNESGVVQMTAWTTYNSEVLIPGYEIAHKDYDKKTKVLILSIIPFLLEDEVIAPIAGVEDYKRNFENLFKHFEVEKRIITETNRKIEREMAIIIRQLEGDSTISGDHRKQLLVYLNNLESLYESNKNTLENVIEKKYNLIFKMKMLIHQKDSINLLSQQELEAYKIKQKKVEEEYQAKITYSLVILGLVLVILLLTFLNNRKIKKQKAIIEEQNRNLDAFVSKASHEIKGPLNSLKGLAGVALKTIHDEEAIQYFEYISKTVQKLTKTVNNMLYFSKAKELKPTYVEVRLHDFVDEVVHSLEYKESFDKIRISNRISSQLAFKSDETILNSIVQNIISNAIKYQDSKKPESYLDIDAEEKNGQLIIRFKDNGIGIESIHRNKLFGMFYRATNEAEGTGLGLYIVRLSAEKLGGKVEFESEAGEYTKFTVSLPNKK
jgi:nitrogen-specific signal transduction histidine kinase